LFGGYAEILYNHADGRKENNNIATDPANMSLIERFQKTNDQLRKKLEN
jgi:hypothetical protein